MRYIFIVNDKAGKGKYRKIIPNIKEACKKRGYIYEIRYISEEQSGKNIALEYINNNDVIYIVGGDGTITNALPGIIYTRNSLGIIPAGSGNDTYRAVKELPEGKTKIDVGKINNTYFINVACTGLDAEVGNNIELLREKPIPSSQLYIASIFYTFFNFVFKKAKLQTKTKIIEDEYSIISICNGSHYGGGFNIAPKAQLTDETFDIYFVEKMSKIKMIPLLLKMKKGDHEGKRRVHKFREKSLKISLDEEVIFNVDGEQLTGKEFDIEVLPRAISIYNDTEFLEEVMNI